ncbi:MAG: hypothetical protein WC876_04970 [Candidatus Thermoplasmatota archaeon]|jgi:hypothetical protein
MRSVAFGAPFLLVAALLVVPPASAGNVDSTEPANNVCSTATVTQSSYWYDWWGTLSSSDTSDFVKLSGVAVNDLITVQRGSGSWGGAYQFRLWNPSCTAIVAAVPATGSTLTYVAPTAGTYAIEYVYNSGSVYYEVLASANPQGTTSCSAFSEAVLTGVANLECTLTTPTCASTCMIHYDVTVDGIGVVSGQFRSATCQLAVTCTGADSEILSGAIVDICRANIQGAALGVTGAAVVTLTCTAWI